MPAILRESLPKRVASLWDIGSYAGIERIQGHGGGPWEHVGLEQYEVSHHVWVLWVPLFYGGWLFAMRLGRDPDPYHCEHEHDHCASHNLMYSWRMVKAGNGLEWAGSGQDWNAYHRLPRRVTKPKSNGSCMCLPLPNLTKIRAH